MKVKFPEIEFPDIEEMLSSLHKEITTHLSKATVKAIGLLTSVQEEIKGAIVHHVTSEKKITQTDTSGIVEVEHIVVLKYYTSEVSDD